MTREELKELVDSSEFAESGNLTAKEFVSSESEFRRSWA